MLHVQCRCPTQPSHHHHHQLPRFLVIKFSRSLFFALLWSVVVEPEVGREVLETSTRPKNKHWSKRAGVVLMLVVDGEELWNVIFIGLSDLPHSQVEVPQFSRFARIRDWVWPKTNWIDHRIPSFWPHTYARHQWANQSQTGSDPFHQPKMMTMLGKSSSPTPPSLTKPTPLFSYYIGFSFWRLPFPLRTPTCHHWRTITRQSGRRASVNYCK